MYKLNFDTILPRYTIVLTAMDGLGILRPNRRQKPLVVFCSMEIQSHPYKCAAAVKTYLSVR